MAELHKVIDGSPAVRARDGIDEVDQWRVESLGHDDRWKTLSGDFFANLPRMRFGPQHRAADSLAHEELRVGFAVGLVALDGHDRHVEALLAEPAHHARHQRAVELGKGNIAREHKANVRRNALADRAVVTQLVGGFEDAVTRAGADFRVVVERARDGCNRNAHSPCDFSN